MAKTETKFMKCKTCGCHDGHACQTNLGPCFWIDENFCSACAVQADNPPTEHAEMFSSALYQMGRPDMVVGLNIFGLIKLLIAKGVITEEEQARALMDQLRIASEPITSPGTIIIPGR